MTDEAKTGKPIQIIYIEEPLRRRPPEPCPATDGPHRWAWLVDGRQACGYCERPRR